jgi:hypothetical protein
VTCSAHVRRAYLCDHRRGQRDRRRAGVESGQAPGGARC